MANPMENLNKADIEKQLDEINKSDEETRRELAQAMQMLAQAKDNTPEAVLPKEEVKSNLEAPHLQEEKGKTGSKESWWTKWRREKAEKNLRSNPESRKPSLQFNLDNSRNSSEKAKKAEAKKVKKENRKDTDNQIPKIPEIKLTPEQQELENKVSEARQKYAEEYKKFLAERKKSLKKRTKVKERVLGVTVKDTEVSPALKQLEAEYNKTLAVFGQSLYDTKKSELDPSGNLTEEQEKELERYKKNEIFTRVIVAEESILNGLKVEQLPPKEKGIIRKAFDLYMRTPRLAKLGISFAMVTAIIAFLLPGMVVAGGGLATFAALRGVRALAGSTFGHMAGEYVGKIFNKRIQSNVEMDKADLQMSFNKNTDFDENALQEDRKAFAEIEEDKRKAEIGATVIKFLVTLGVGGAASLGAGYGVSKLVNTSFSPSAASQTESWVKNKWNEWFGDKKTSTPVEPLESPTGEEEMKQLAESKKILQNTSPGKSQPVTELKTENAKVLEDAVIKKGEGIEHAFIRQIEHNPAMAKSLGFTGDINNAKSLHLFAQKQAHIIALKTGYADHSGNEVRIGVADKASYEIKLDKDGNYHVEERFAGGEAKIHNQGTKFNDIDKEYEYKKGSSSTHQEVKSKTGSSTRIEELREKILNKQTNNSVTEPSQKNIIIEGNTLVEQTTTEIKPTSLKTEVLIDKNIDDTTEKIDKVKIRIENTIDTNNTSSNRSLESQTQNQPIPKEEILNRNPQLKQNWALFEKNEYNLNEEQLKSANATYEQVRNTNPDEWEYDKNAAAKNYVGASTKTATVQYLDKLQETSGLKPKVSAVLDTERDETVEKYAARTIQKISKDGNLDKIDSFKPKKE